MSQYHMLGLAGWQGKLQCLMAILKETSYLPVTSFIHVMQFVILSMLVGSSRSFYV
jgi:hypothetical protein